MDSAALRPGDPERLGPYDVTGRLGEGGQGTVFLGTDRDDRPVAIKLLHSELTEDDTARARFIREVEVAKRVAPFCTAQLIDADVAGDRPYIVSEYVPGPSLYRHVQDDGPLTGAKLDRLAVGTSTALAAIHQADILHRDFKPHNVLIGPDGPRVIDFGVAKAISGSSTLTSRVIGTPAYMAPEQLRGDDAGTAADVFCWAATMVFAAAGRPPFGQDTIPAVINRILHEEPELGDLSGPLRELVADCLAKEPADRPAARVLLMRLLGHDERIVVPAQAGPAEVAPDATRVSAGAVSGVVSGAASGVVAGVVAAAAAPGAAAPLGRDASAILAEGSERAAERTDDGEPTATAPTATAPTTTAPTATGPSPQEWARHHALPDAGQATMGSGEHPHSGGFGPGRPGSSMARSLRPVLLGGAAMLLVAMITGSVVFAALKGGATGGRRVDPADQPRTKTTSTEGPQQRRAVVPGADRPTFTSPPPTTDPERTPKAPQDTPSTTPEPTTPTTTPSATPTESTPPPVPSDEPTGETENASNTDG